MGEEEKDGRGFVGVAEGLSFFSGRVRVVSFSLFLFVGCVCVSPPLSFFLCLFLLLFHNVDLRDVFVFQGCCC